MKWKRAVQVFGVTLCLIQLHSITRTYLDFGVITKVSIEISENVQLPAFTLCEFIGHLIGAEVLRGRNVFVDGVPFDNLTDIEQEIYLKSPLWYVTMEDFLKMHTIGELQELVQPKRSKFKLWKVTDPTSYAFKGDFSDHFKSTDSFMGQTVCRTITPRNPKSFVYKRKLLSQSQLPNMMVFYSVERPPRNFAPWLVSLSPAGQLPWNSQTGYSSLEVYRSSRGFIVQYKQMEARRLEWPYSTNCWDYKQSGFECRQHEYQECLNKMTTMYWNSTVVGCFVQWDSYSEAYFENVDREELQTDRWKSILSLCTQQTSRPDCNEQHYTITAIHSLDVSGNASYFVIIPPNEPRVITKYHPKMSVIDFIIDFGSTLGYWLGFSFVTSCIEFLTALGSLYATGRKKLQVVYSSRRISTNFHRTKTSLWSHFLGSINRQSNSVSAKHLSVQSRQRRIHIIKLA